MKRARPTLRLLREDLGETRFTYLADRCEEDPALFYGLSELDHPILIKAAECFTGEPGQDRHEGTIKSATQYTLFEIKSSQWRGGVWKDESGTAWVISVGLAKGGHRDYDDFYKRIERDHQSPETAAVILPNDTDRKLLLAEKANAVYLDWKLDIQRLVLAGLLSALDGHPSPQAVRLPDGEYPKVPSYEREVLTFRIEVDETSPLDEISIRFKLQPRWSSSKLGWQLQVFVLNAIYPPLYRWDALPNSLFYCCEEEGFWRNQARELSDSIDKKEVRLLAEDPHAHYLHKVDIEDSAQTGEAKRALCGTYVVSHRDTDGLEPCPECAQEYARLNKTIP
ncbi:DUF3039 domain-containing protein [Corynebacterium cystitidis]|uniref:Uncharacterized protein n=1 Tax=Corynebacterium cystitidis DSM 20524 TaxID=1121357 RepID=A0A1H9TAW9_9CORY|nr:DUF3039 domain-containing protein [Corynebacterium cystitidis]WJY83540.1 hypothetical protein CCYS_13280 [Corynebacterium cystitidis DSM 20524]SER94460.1 Protein of unknown function [Corynebacterium cystitidis DSM 20524]SNV92214.1 Protein of uncharacterised function (DUF3039) [Corynebacterium cystitidis]